MILWVEIRCAAAKFTKLILCEINITGAQMGASYNKVALI